MGPTATMLLVCLTSLAPTPRPASSAPAIDVGTHDVSCTALPRTAWLDRQAISRKVVAAGYKVIVLLDVKGSCYHVRALTRARLQADVDLDPVTGDIVSAALFDE